MHRDNQSERLSYEAKNGVVTRRMDNITLKRISYRELRDGMERPFEDSWHMISGYLNPSVKSTLLANPNLNDYTKSALNLVIYNGTVVGRNMLMPTKIKAGDSYFHAQSGGSYEVNDQYRGHGFGTISFKDSILNSEYDAYIGQLYSTTAISIVRKLGLIVFELPSYYKLCRSRSFLESRGLSGIPLNLFATVVDCVLKIMNVPNSIRLRKLLRKYSCREVKIVPEWVNDITLHDGHEYAEVHDSNWFQWCLDNRFTECPLDLQSFFVVYDKRGEPKGFFMTKVRYEEGRGKYKKSTRGTIVEWGSYDEEVLSEIDLTLLATFSFGTDVDNITTVLSNPAQERAIKRMGYLRHGSFQMSVKPGNLRNDNISDKSKWRIRYGGCNTIVF